MDFVTKFERQDLKRIDEASGVPKYLKAASKDVVCANYQKAKAASNYQLKNQSLKAVSQGK